jgi:hypothetical protein
MAYNYSREVQNGEQIIRNMLGTEETSNTQYSRGSGSDLRFRLETKFSTGNKGKAEAKVMVQKIEKT